METKTFNDRLFHMVQSYQNDLNKNHRTESEPITEIPALLEPTITVTHKAMGAFMLVTPKASIELVPITKAQQKAYVARLVLPYTWMVHTANHPDGGAAEVKQFLNSMSQAIFKKQGFNSDVPSVGNGPRITFFRPGPTTSTWITDLSETTAVELRAYSDAIPLGKEDLVKYLKEETNE